MNQDKNSLRNKLTSENYLRVSYALLHRFDSATSLFVSQLVKQEIYNEGQGNVDSDGYFLFMKSYVSKRLNLTDKQQLRITKLLQDQNLIQYKRVGCPPKGWIKLNHAVINGILDNFTFSEGE